MVIPLQQCNSDTSLCRALTCAIRYPRLGTTIYAIYVYGKATLSFYLFLFWDVLLFVLGRVKQY